MIKTDPNFVECGKRLSEIFAKTLTEIKAGKKLIEIESFADKLIEQSGGKASFKMVPKYHWATCINLNEGVVHGIPNETVIKEGDVVSLDIGLFYKGWHTDMAYTIQIKNSEESKFLQIGKLALERAIEKARVGNRVGHISRVIEETIENAGYHCVRDLTGHGVGKRLHQEPWIPCFEAMPLNKTLVLTEGMGLAIEVIYTKGHPDIARKNDGWTIVSADGKMSALFEKTVIVSKDRGKVITPFLWDRKINK